VTKPDLNSEPVIQMGSAGVERILAAAGKPILPDFTNDQLIESLLMCATEYHAAVYRHSNKLVKDQIRRLEKAVKAAARLRDLLAADEAWAQLQRWENEYLQRSIKWGKLSKEDLLVRDGTWAWSRRVAKLPENLSAPNDARERNSYWENEYLLHEIGNLIGRLEGTLGDLNSELLWGPDFDLAMRLGASPWALANRFKERSPFEWLVGNWLPEIYAHYFGIRAGLQRRRDGKLDGPFIRFAEKALVELRIMHRGRPYTREAIARALTDARANRVRRKPTSLAF
jgi:hypothetical protein